MYVWAFIRWWYGPGWRDRLTAAKLRLAKTSDYFSISLMARNLFQPFRQISAGSVRGSLEVHLRAWLDRLISRFIGTIIRSFMIIIGAVWWLVLALTSVVWLAIWALLPLMPLVGLGLSTGVGQ